MLRTLRDTTRRLGAVIAFLVALLALAPMAQANVCVCDTSEIASADADASAAQINQNGTDQNTTDENCACPACHCYHVGNSGTAPLQAVALAVFAAERNAPLSDARLLPIPPNTLERPPRV